jgi:hypothetical protein
MRCANPRQSDEARAAVKPIGEVIFEVDDTLTALGVDYALGGALALAYYAEPRGTADIDLCVSTPFTAAATLASELTSFGWSAQGAPAEWLPVAGIRFARTGEGVTLDVFFSFDDYHLDALRGAVRKPFLFQGQRRDLPFLAADDLVVFKVSFGRGQDWVDITRMLESGTSIDPDYVERQLIRFRGPTMYPRVARLRAIAENHRPRAT